MSEQDLGLKIASRRLAWQQGFSTRLNVPLRTVVAQRPGGPAFQEYTDLDVLALRVDRNMHVDVDVYDCRSSTSGSTERAFWLKGLREYFQADAAWLVRERGVADSARNLAAELGLGVMSRDDVDIMTKIHQADSDHPPAIARLFDEDGIRLHQDRIKDVDRKLRGVRDAIRYDVWVIDRYRVLSFLPGELHRAARDLRSDNPLHVALILDAAWVYLMALAHSAQYVAATGASRLQDQFGEYFLGGQAAMREKEATRKAFNKLAGAHQESLTPHYYPNLLEVFARFWIRPQAMTAAMRYLEVVQAGVVVSKRPQLPAAFGEAFDAVSAKLALDVVTFLATAADLAPSFKPVFRDLLLGAPESTDGAPAGGKPVSSQPEDAAATAVPDKGTGTAGSPGKTGSRGAARAPGATRTAGEGELAGAGDDELPLDGAESETTGNQTRQ